MLTKIGKARIEMFIRPALTILVVSAPFFAASAYALSTNEAAAKFGTRAPTACPEVTAAKSGPPPAAEVKSLVMCNYEQETGGFGNEAGRAVLLMDDVKVQVGRPIPFHADLMAHDADSNFPFYPIRGSFTSVMCRREFSYSTDKGKNCMIQHFTQDTGLCWHTGFGDWKCGFGGRDSRTDETVTNQPPTAGTASR